MKRLLKTTNRWWTLIVKAFKTATVFILPAMAEVQQMHNIWQPNFPEDFIQTAGASGGSPALQYFLSDRGCQ